MNSLKIDEWKEFKLKDIFTFQKGKCSNAPDLEEGNEIPYIGAKKDENGVMKWVKKDEELVSKGNCISFICQGEGSNGFNNYFDINTIQSTSNIMGYNKDLNEYNGLFIVTVLDLERPKWSFGRGRAPKLKETVIKLPAILVNKKWEPDWKYMENYIKTLRKEEKEVSELVQPLIHEKNELTDFSKWKEFKIKEIFEKPEIKKYSSIPEEKGNIMFVTSKSTNQGIETSIQTKFFTENVITISTNGNCYDCFYHKNKVAISSDVEVITNKYLNKFNAHFLIPILKLEQKKWNYGRKPKNNAVMETVIKLPAILVNKKWEPDWEYMENYIKSLPYSKYI